MKARKPRPTASGWIHHASLRMVSPKDRFTGSAVTFDGIESPFGCARAMVPGRPGPPKTRAVPGARPPKYAQPDSGGNAFGDEPKEAPGGRPGWRFFRAVANRSSFERFPKRAV